MSPKPAQTKWKPLWARITTTITSGAALTFCGHTAIRLIYHDRRHPEEMFHGLGAYVGSSILLGLFLQTLVLALFLRRGGKLAFILTLPLPVILIRTVLDMMK